MIAAYADERYFHMLFGAGGACVVIGFILIIVFKIEGGS